jgi:hypothetical protein
MVVALERYPSSTEPAAGREGGREDHKYILVLLRSKMSIAFFDVLWQYSE